MATQNDSSFKKGQSTTRPPYFNGNDYPYWKTRMRIYLQALDYDIWEIVSDGLFMPTIEMEKGKKFQGLHVNEVRQKEKGLLEPQSHECIILYLG